MTMRRRTRRFPLIPLLHRTAAAMPGATRAKPWDLSSFLVANGTAARHVRVSRLTVIVHRRSRMAAGCRPIIVFVREDLETLVGEQLVLGLAGPKLTDADITLVRRTPPGGRILDALTDRYTPNTGIRSYGKDPAVVTRYGLARIKGMQKGGISACAKHFPGKGHSPLDAHLKLPTIDSSLADMQVIHLPPFHAAIADGIDCLMTSHPVYPNLDPTGVPATFSRRIVRDYLRDEAGFKGVIISDDLEMGAIG